MIANVSHEEIIDAIEIHWKLQLGSYFKSVHDLGGTVYNLGGRVTDYWWNYAGIIRAEKGDEAKLIDKIVTFAKDNDRTPAVYIDPTVQPLDFPDHLSKKGFRPEEDEIWMFYDASILVKFQHPPDLRIVEVQNKKDMMVFIDVFNAAYEMLEEGCIDSPYSLSLLDAFKSPPIDIEIHHYIGFVGKKAVTVGSIYMTNDVAGLYNVGTYPEDCRRGYGSAVSMKIISESKKRKHRRLLLQTDLGSDADRLYQKLGFRQAFSGAIWSTAEED